MTPDSKALKKAIRRLRKYNGTGGAKMPRAYVDGTSSWSIDNATLAKEFMRRVESGEIRL
jgi:hypothetical protein